MADFFINPYNFIELKGKCDKKYNALDTRKSKTDNNGNNLMTGVINCTMTTKTPIFIPNTTNDNINNGENKNHKSYDFFSYEDLTKKGSRTQVPIIPGSSIRGSIRSLYEAVTGSCFGVVDEEKILHKRMPDPGIPAIIRYENGKFRLYKSEKFMIKYKQCEADKNRNFKRELEDKRDGTELWVKPDNHYKGKSFMPKVVSDISFEKKGNGYIRCYLIKGGEIFKKHHYTAIQADVTNCVATLDDMDIKRLENILSLYGDEKLNLNLKGKGEHDGFKDYKKLVENLRKNKVGEVPVYYKEEKKGIAYYLSPACITKEVYNTKVQEILAEMGGYNTCTHITNICDACNLFGMVGEKNNASNSRIRFGDAKPSNDVKDYFGNVITLRELSSPKVSATEFYLEKHKDDHIWTYDYSGKWNGNNLAVSTGYKAKIRGRKFYWHHRGNNVKTEAPSDRNVTIRPVKENKKFEFKVFFERITKDELEKMLWVLTLGENIETSSMQHRIGMGKPVGLGSVKVTVDSVFNRVIDLNSDNLYELKEVELTENDLELCQNYFEESNLNQIKKAFNVKTPNANIEYPSLGNDGDKSYEWFGSNKKGGKNQFKPHIIKVLPNIMDKDIRLSKKFGADDVKHKGAIGGSKKNTKKPKEEEFGNFGFANLRDMFNK